MPTADKPYVLLVEDNEATTALVLALLQRDFSVEMASDGAEAIEQLKIRHYRAVILDLKMPGVDGFAVLEYLREHQPAMIPHVLVVTAALTRRDVERVKQFPICALIPKPFEVDLLLAAVKHCADPDERPAGGPLTASGMILLLADLLRG